MHGLIPPIFDGEKVDRLGVFQTAQGAGALDLAVVGKMAYPRNTLARSSKTFRSPPWNKDRVCNP
jgi:hypothetical protein